MPIREYNFTGFDHIKVGGAFDVEVKKADGFRVSVDADMLKPVQVKKTGETVDISLPWYYYFWGFLTAFIRAKIYITLPELRSIALYGASQANVDAFTTQHDFSIELAGASRLDISTIKCGNAEIRLVGASKLTMKRLEAGDLKMEMMGASRADGEIVLSTGAVIKIVGASRAELKGEASNLRLDVAGASQARLTELSAHNAKIKLTGASRAVVKIDGRLDADVAGASDLSWVGNPVMGDIKSVGASQLHRA